MAKKAHLYPSLICAASGTREAALQELAPLVTGFHIDVMDGHFVPNQAFTLEEIHALAPISSRPFWIHLMVQDPAAYLPRLSAPAHSMVSVHYESTPHLGSLLNAIKERGWATSLALKPSTPLEAVIPLLAHLDQVLIMGVEPGFSGQPLQAATYNKVAALHELLIQQHSSCRIGVDGGIKLNTIGRLYTNGATDFAIGSALFESASLTNTLNHFHEQLHKGVV